MTKLDFSKLLGQRYADIDPLNDKEAPVKERLNMAENMVRNFGMFHYGKSDIIQRLHEIKTDQELLDFCLDVFKIKIPYIAVGEGMQSPGQAFCDAFFGRANYALWWASRGSFKSYGTGLLAVLDALRFNGCDTKILAGSQEQGTHIYNAAATHIGNAKLEHMFRMQRTYTEAITGSSFSVLTASPKSARGHHPVILRMDEVDEIPRDIYNAAINQPMSKNGLKAQLMMTSTMHKPQGLMAEIVDSAPSTGLKVYKWNYLGVTERCNEFDCRKLQFSEKYRGEICPLLGDYVPNKELVSEDERGRLAPAREYVTITGRDHDGEVLEGYYDGSCQGHLRRADGYVPVDDQRAARSRVPKRVWEVENECRRPSQEDMVYDPILLQRGTIENVTWDFSLPSERSWAMVDWGFNNPTAFLLAQERIIEGKPLNTQPYHKCILKEWYWEQRGLNWRIEQIVKILMEHDIHQIYADAENLDALHALREALADKHYECLVRGVPFNRFKDKIIDIIRNDMEQGHWFISETGCPQTIKDLYRLHYKPNTEDVAKENDHGPDAMIAGWRRYINFGDLSRATGADLASIQRGRAQPGAGPGIRGFASNPVVLGADSPVGVSSRNTGGNSRSRRNVNYGI